MHLEHLNLVVNDLQATLKFYQAAFPHWKIRSQGKSNWYEYERTWLHFGDDYQYLAFSDHGCGDNRNLEGNQIGLAHFAYVISDIEALQTRLEKEGFHYSIPLRYHQFRKNIYYLDPNGFEIEFVQYLSDVPSERNSD